MLLIIYLIYSTKYYMVEKNLMRSMNTFTDCIQSVRNFLDQKKITQALITNKGRNFIDQQYYIEKRGSYQREPIILCAI